ncbi:hypothetical protein [Streptomyces sp. ODS05-4]|uniref:hypothetical protein n=1 Tax=Streptomyces sp. ODS05-4 TaxID=2944939 RepID=UPI00210A3401|nr:hypothetical protein [Streptomyces sp. ODS05-4]
MAENRTLPEVDRDLAAMEKEAKEKFKELRQSFSGTSISVSEISRTVNKHSSTQNDFSKTVNKHSETISGFTKTVNGHSETINGYSKTINHHSVTLNDLSVTMSRISATTAWLSGTATLATASVAALTVSLSLFKLDEKGITILGVTREFKWSKKLHDWIRKHLEDRIENSDQKAKRNQETDDKKKLDQLYKDVDKIKLALSSARNAMDAQRGVERTRFNGPNQRGLDTTHGLGPTVRGVASDVRLLRSAVDQLAIAIG